MADVEKTDHDILNTLVADFKNMKESQEKFHQEMKDSFKDLKDNYAGRLYAAEQEIIKLQRDYVAKVDQARTDAAILKRLAWLERIAYLATGVMLAVEFYFRFFH